MIVRRKPYSAIYFFFVKENSVDLTIFVSSKYKFSN